MLAVMKRANIEGRDAPTTRTDCGIGLIACEQTRAGEYLTKLKEAESKANFAAADRFSDFSTSYQRRGTVAVLHLDGLLLPRRPWWTWGLAVTGLDEFAAQLDRATTDETVSSILIRVFSGGGTTDSVGDVADAVYRSRRAKSVVAYLENIAGSAAYWIASAAETIVTSPFAEAGSIGVYTVIDDVSEAFQRAGIKTRRIRSAQLKGIGVPGVVISDEEVAQLQRRVDQFHALFVQGVARGRSISAREVEKLATGATWVGQQAVAIGLADKVGTFDETVAELNKNAPPPRLVPRAALSIQSNRRSASGLFEPSMDRLNDLRRRCGRGWGTRSERSELERLKAMFGE